MRGVTAAANRKPVSTRLRSRGGRRVSADGIGSGPRSRQACDGRAHEGCPKQEAAGQFASSLNRWRSAVSVSGSRPGFIGSLVCVVCAAPNDLAGFNADDAYFLLGRIIHAFNRGCHSRRRVAVGT